MMQSSKVGGYEGGGTAPAGSPLFVCVSLPHFVPVCLMFKPTRSSDEASRRCGVQNTHLASFRICYLSHNPFNYDLDSS